MLASSSSFLVSATPAPPGAPGGGDTPGKPAAAPGFAALLDRLSALAEGADADDGALPPGAHAAVATAFAKGLAAAVGLPRPAIAGQAASDNGKDLPDALPEAAETGDEPDADAASGLGETGTAVLPVITQAALLLAATPAARPESSAAAPDDRSGVPDSLPRGLVQPAATAADAASAKPKLEAPGAEARPMAAVAVTVSATPSTKAVRVGPGRVAVTPSDPAGPVSARAPSAAGLAQADAAPAQPPSAAPAIAELRPSPAAITPTLATGAVAPGPSSGDINAALDRLVAAREALMPAEAALSIDHAEFGEISIRFEHKADGRLSAELAGADPELHRAVAAAVAADRGLAAGTDGDQGRSGPFASQRESAGSSDSATGERGQSGDRDEPHRRAPGRPGSHQASSDPRPGIFA